MITMITATSTRSIAACSRRSRWAAVALVAALLSACGGDDDVAAPDTGPVVDSTAVTTSVPDTAADDTTTTTASSPTTAPPAVTNPPPGTEPPPETTQPGTPPPGPPPPPDAATIATAFDPVSGSTPRVLLSVLVTADPGAVADPNSTSWSFAGGPPENVTLTGDQFWVQFRVENEDFFGSVTDVAISAAGLADGMCTGVGPIASNSTATCVQGPFALTPGPQTFDVSITANGERQMFGDLLISPPLTPPTYQGAPISYFILFDLTPAGGPETGALIQGTAEGPNVAVSGAVEATIVLDCDRPGEGAGLPVVAWSIVYFDTGGASTSDSCFDVPVNRQPYGVDDGSDRSISFTGS